MSKKIKCIVCSVDISYKKSNNTSKCDKCIRILTSKMRDAIIERGKSNARKNEFLNAYDKKCVVCGWNISDENIAIIMNAKGKHLRQRGCEFHHIIPVRDGGESTFNNLILLCPNHHKEADLGILSIDELKKLIPVDMQKAVEKRRLDNSGEELLDNMF